MRQSAAQHEFYSDMGVWYWTLVSNTRRPWLLLDIAAPDSGD